MAGAEITQSVAIDEAAILRSLSLNPADPNVQALILVCREYGLDPVLKHMVLISGRPYITRDGLLHVAHRSNQFDGIEVIEEGESDTEWWAKVSVYRKDMGRPFTYRGRYPKADARHMAKYGPEMAVKVAEVMALRRAFDVTGIATAEEQWIEAVDPVIAGEDAERIRTLVGATADPKATRAEFRERFGHIAADLPLSLLPEVNAWLDTLETVGEPVSVEASPARRVPTVDEVVDDRIERFADAVATDDEADQ